MQTDQLYGTGDVTVTVMQTEIPSIPLRRGRGDALNVQVVIMESHLCRSYCPSLLCGWLECFSGDGGCGASQKLHKCSSIGQHK